MRSADGRIVRREEIMPSNCYFWAVTAVNMANVCQVTSWYFVLLLDWKMWNDNLYWKEPSAISSSSLTKACKEQLIEKLQVILAFPIKSFISNLISWSPLRSQNSSTFQKIPDPQSCWSPSPSPIPPSPSFCSSLTLACSYLALSHLPLWIHPSLQPSNPLNNQSIKTSRSIVLSIISSLNPQPHSVTQPIGKLTYPKIQASSNPPPPPHLLQVPYLISTFASTVPYYST